MIDEAATFDRHLGELLRLNRVSAGVSRADLAERLGIRRKDIKRIESGRRGISARLLVELTHALGVSPSVLLDEVGRREAYVEPPMGPVDEACRSLLASNRGRQLIRAMATCRHPEVLDAVFRLLIANAIHVLPEDAKLTTARG